MATATIDIANLQVFVEVFIYCSSSILMLNCYLLNFSLPRRKSSSRSPATVQLELGLVDTFLSFCRVGWQMWLAEIEFSFFCPLLLTQQS
ncbi:hypothetical protein D8674_008398 [Pyrus ussuriensis x Pyrus communis]|uniref:Uncharacterized protein n=1 Tax=Pyrus ussuriensis x Pyrus communis TaxID=2448454 RepID=A0A5N5HSX8_9ROSA|nr:hypothetical protein D8674_008398 [Pyrus ussuriensis x Pyrus communis]